MTNISIPFVDLNRQYESIKKLVSPTLEKTIKNDYLIEGQEVNQFEKEFASFLGVKHCISVNSGTDALIIGMRSLQLDTNDEVIVPANSFIATALAATENSLKPVFVDCDPRDQGINLDDLKKKINSRTRAIIAVHLYGQPEKIDEINMLIKKSGKKIYFIEDAAQAHGAKYNGIRVGGFGAFAGFSFYPTKNLGAYGDGGAITTNNPKVAKLCRYLKQYGQTKKYFHVLPGINSRLDTIQASILRKKLPLLLKWNEKRQKNANLYSTELKKTKLPIIVPPFFENRKSIFHIYAIRIKRRNQLQKYLLQNKIATLIHYPKPLHLQEAFSKLRYRKGDLPFAEKIASELLSLPMFPELSENEIKYVITNISNFYSHK